ncbi:MAG: hypothetical protein LJE88_18765 [Deltaproteobacteria bacterium]|nr:hypothetical protein [Deltaproteobacteria bacterium]
MDLTDDPLAGVDASELEADIDKAIDELFVKKGETKEAPPAKPDEPAEKPAKEPKDVPAAEPTPVEQLDLADDQLAELKESLLTLDWEITPESIGKFEKELQLVSDKLSEDRHSMAVIKMALGVLQYLRAAQESASPISVQFLHGAIRGLDLFVREPAPTDSERSEVMDKLLSQFRRVKAEIQRVKPREAPAPAEEAAAVEPEPTEQPVLDEITAEEPELEDLTEQAVVTEEIIEDEPFLEEPSEEEPILEEITAEELTFDEPSVEEPTLAAELEEEPILEEITAEELTFDEPAPEESTLTADHEEEPILEEITAEELTFDEPAPEESTLTADHEEEPALSLDLDEEPSLEELFKEEPVTEETPGEDLPFAPLLDEEGDVEEVLGEELGLEELPEEEPSPEPMVEPEEIAPAPAVGVGEIPATLQNLVKEAKDHSGRLANGLAALTEETRDFFGRILKAMAGKPALAKLENYFSSAHDNLEVRISEAQQLSGNLVQALATLEQNLGRQQAGTVAPHAQSAINSQVKTIENAIQKISQATSQLQRSLTGKAGAPAASYEGIAFKDAPAEMDEFSTEEFSFESDDLMESLDSEPVLDLVDEIPSEPLSPKPGIPATIYLADVANNTLGVPTEAVANVFKLSKGKAKAIRKRGYARLADFKGAFRSIKRGITGPLADLKPKELKKLQFPLISLSPKILGSEDTEAVAPVRGIVLLSTGQRHGGLLTDEVMQRTPYDVKGYKKAALPGEVSGTATIEGDFEINVINPDNVLS